jgi:G:T/U-mismatch repair DNA glycosylase
MTEINPFRYFLPSQPQILVVGSFPCFNGTDYGDWFYSGSGRNYLWQLLSDVFDMPVSSREEKRRLCEQHHIAFTDIAYKVVRKLGNCSDANLDILEYNDEGVKKCLGSSIRKIFFTGRYVADNFVKRYHPEVPFFVLPSPSPAANKHIGGLAEYKKLFSSGKVRSTYDYRLVKYREMFDL